MPSSSTFFRSWWIEELRELLGIANSLLLQTALLSTIEGHKIPIVLIGRETAGTEISSVSIENEDGVRLAIKHLYELGHRKIGFLKGQRILRTVRNDGRELQGSQARRGLILDPKLITVQFQCRGSSYEAGFKAARELIQRKRKFTALLAFDDLAAFGAIRALTQAGKNVPLDCSVIGFDDIAAAAFYNPPITTVHQPMELLGTSAVEIFFDLDGRILHQETVHTGSSQDKTKAGDPRIYFATPSLTSAFPPSGVAGGTRLNPCVGTSKPSRAGAFHKASSETTEGRSFDQRDIETDEFPLKATRIVSAGGDSDGNPQDSQLLGIPYPRHWCCRLYDDETTRIRSPSPNARRSWEAPSGEAGKPDMRSNPPSLCEAEATTCSVSFHLWITRSQRAFTRTGENEVVNPGVVAAGWNGPEEPPSPLYAGLFLQAQDFGEARVFPNSRKSGSVYISKLQP